MTVEQMRAYFSSHKKGQFVSVKYYKELPVLSCFRSYVKCYKVVTTICRWGINYNNISKVKEKREKGDLPQTPKGLPWGEWMEFPIFIRHNDNIYVRLVLCENHKRMSCTKYYIVENGIPGEFDKSTVQSYCRKFPSSEPPDIITINIDNILEFGGLKK